MTKVFVPREIKVGFQQRQDTYTGKLAYVVYVDDKGKTRKESSWEGWRDDKIPVADFENVPTEGFVLNKKVGGVAYHYDVRQTYVRVYDPRGFEFEITIPNLVYVLENANSIKGKGLEGEFVYGWDGSELLLIPTAAPDYAQMISDRDVLYDKKSIKAKDLVLGATYRTRKGQSLVYMGRYQRYQKYANQLAASTLAYFFYDAEATMYTRWNEPPTKGDFTAIVSLSSYLIGVIDENPASNYAELMDRLTKQPIYSPHDKSKDTYPPFTLEEFKPKSNDRLVFYSGEKAHELHAVRPYQNWWDYENGIRAKVKPGIETWQVVQYTNGYSAKEFMTLEEAFDFYQPQHKDLYLENGSFYRRES